MKADRSRSRFYTRDLKTITNVQPERGRPDSTLSRNAHGRGHDYLTLVWNSPDPPVAAAGRILRPPSGGRIVAVRISAESAVSADSVWDVKLGTESIFHTSTKPTIKNGDTVGNWYRPDRKSWQKDEALTIINSSGLPATKVVAEIRFVPRYL